MIDAENVWTAVQELVSARGPCGQEEEVRQVCQGYLQDLCDRTWVDEAGNLIGLLKGATDEGPAIQVMAHMDELAMVVKRVNDDGTLRVNPLGGIYPGNFGQGPVEILGDEGILPGVLSAGPMHITPESATGWAIKPKGGNKAPDWEHVYVVTRQSAEELKAAGVHAGSRVVIAQNRRGLFEVGDAVGGYFLDDRIAIAMMLGAASILKLAGKRPAADVYLVCTTHEEIGAHGATYAARTLPGDITLALDVGPAAAEYGIELTAAPIVVYGDRVGLYDKGISDRLLACGRQLDLDPQCAYWQGYASDASLAKAYGQTARSGLLCIATENTHGYEMVIKDGLWPCARLLAAFLEQPRKVA